MKKVCSLLFLLGFAWALQIAVAAPSAGAERDQSLDADWRFLRSDAPGAETPAFADSTWRRVDVPHDWSIEDLPSQGTAGRVGPFAPGESVGRDKTGYVLGGIGWYWKHFILTAANKIVAVRFDGVCRTNPDSPKPRSRTHDNFAAYTSP